MTASAAPPDASAAEPSLPTYGAEQFLLSDPPECDMVMKGGITSGVVYPYAVLEIATKYRLRSIGGTSAGAIAAAFAAAAEYGRRNGRPEAFLTLKRYCDRLPEILPSLFQPSPEFGPAVEGVRSAIEAGGVRPVVRHALGRGVLPALAGGALLGVPSLLVQSSAYATVLAATLGAAAGGALGIYRWARRSLVDPMLDALSRLPRHQFGFCTGLTQPSAATPALTDWMHAALQDIAFGDPAHPVPLTFGDLCGPDPKRPEIDLRVVTTNLSMRRPHTLPSLGLPAGFEPAEWDRLFPKSVMDYLYGGGSSEWDRLKGAWQFPQEAALPVVVAVRMSLSFPVLFTAIPVKVVDTELPAVIGSLGGESDGRIATVHFSDGGISSNFPIHMFDAWLPSRPTFAFSLDELPCDASLVRTRVALPEGAGDGMGIQIGEIGGVGEFAWHILNSAKDWQDQLLSGITGQRERIARIYLTDREGGLNLSMPPDVSRRLMAWGYEAGRKFVDGDFDFDEHRWRRLLALHQHLESNLDAVDRVWNGGFATWYRGYAPHARSYTRLGKADRARIASDLSTLLAARGVPGAIKNPDGKFPKRTGALKIVPRY